MGQLVQGPSAFDRQVPEPSNWQDSDLLSTTVDDSDFLGLDLFINGEFLFANICSPPVYLTADGSAEILPHSLPLYLNK